jgi:hypothetical protein
MTEPSSNEQGNVMVARQELLNESKSLAKAAIAGGRGDGEVTLAVSQLYRTLAALIPSDAPKISEGAALPPAA